MILRPFNTSDGAAWYSWYHDPELKRYFRGYTAGASLEQCCNAPHLMKAHILIGLNADGDRVGAVSFADTNRILRVFRFGLLVDPQFQHQGYGKDLLAQGLAWAFDTMNAHKVFHEVIADDQRIHDGAAIAGFTVEGVSRQSVYLDGNFHDEVVSSILREEYYGSRKSTGSTV